jgi:hypothetical protein
MIFFGCIINVNIEENQILKILLDFQHMKEMDLQQLLLFCQTFQSIRVFSIHRCLLIFVINPQQIQGSFEQHAHLSNVAYSQKSFVSFEFLFVFSLSLFLLFLNVRNS